MAAIANDLTDFTNIFLSGSLALKFGRSHKRKLDSGKTYEVLTSLVSTLPDFAHEINRLSLLGMEFAIFRNGKNSNENSFGLNNTREIRIVPVVSGSKRAGSWQTIVGAVLIAIAIFTPGGSILAGQLLSAIQTAGIGLLAGGIIQMLSPQLSGLSQSAAPENLPSYAFGSARNTTASGNNVPICIGERRWGGSIISASIYAEDRA